MWLDATPVAVCTKLIDIFSHFRDFPVTTGVLTETSSIEGEAQSVTTTAVMFLE